MYLLHWYSIYWMWPRPLLGKPASSTLREGIFSTKWESKYPSKVSEESNSCRESRQMVYIYYNVVNWLVRTIPKTLINRYGPERFLTNDTDREPYTPLLLPLTLLIRYLLGDYTYIYTLRRVGTSSAYRVRLLELLYRSNSEITFAAKAREMKY